MPRSRKPRKKYHKRVLVIPGISNVTVEKIKDELVNAGLAAHVKLATGECSSDDMQKFREIINMGTALSALESKTLEPDYVSEAVAALRTGGNAWLALDSREKNLGRFVASGNEINSIQLAVDYGTVLIEDGLRNNASKTVRRWIGLNQYAGDGAPAGVTEMTENEIQQVVLTDWGAR